MATPKESPDPAACSQYLKGLADADRLTMLRCLMGGPKSVGELVAATGKPFANVSHHLVVMRGCGLVTSKRAGRFIIYELRPEIHTEESGEAAALDFGCCRFELTPGGAEAKASVPKHHAIK